MVRTGVTRRGLGSGECSKVGLKCGGDEDTNPGVNKTFPPSLRTK